MDENYSIKYKTICPNCGCELDVTNERREQFNCYICNHPLVFTATLPKGEPYEIDGRYVI